MSCTGDFVRECTPTMHTDKEQPLQQIWSYLIVFMYAFRTIADMHTPRRDPRSPGYFDALLEDLYMTIACIFSVSATSVILDDVNMDIVKDCLLYIALITCLPEVFACGDMILVST